jgi:hypothetical protein
MLLEVIGYGGLHPISSSPLAQDFAPSHRSVIRKQLDPSMQSMPPPFLITGWNDERRVLQQRVSDINMFVFLESIPLQSELKLHLKSKSKCFHLSKTDVRDY